MKPEIKKKKDKHFSLNIYIILANNLTKKNFKRFFSVICIDKSFPRCSQRTSSVEVTLDLMRALLW